MNWRAVFRCASFFSGDLLTPLYSACTQKFEGRSIAARLRVSLLDSAPKPLNAPSSEPLAQNVRPTSGGECPTCGLRELPQGDAGFVDRLDATQSTIIAEPPISSAWHQSGINLRSEPQTGAIESENAAQTLMNFWWAVGDSNSGPAD